MRLVALPFLISASLVVPVHRAEAQFKSPVAIIDVSLDVRPFLPRLKSAGVSVIGRYLARCFEWEGKRMVDNGERRDPQSEVAAILASGLGILTIYQYRSSGPLKFEGRWRNPRTGEITVLPDADCSTTPATPHTVEQEAELDGKEAVEQARRIRQPAAAAVYVGIDFNFDGSQKVADGLLAYMTIMSRHLRTAGYKVGAYGSGSALQFLQSRKHGAGQLNGRPLVDYFWLSGARGHAGSAAFHNDNTWHLIQTWTDIHWFTEMPTGCVKGLELDPDIQNKRFAGADIGFWGARGAFIVPRQRTIAVYDGHRFICNGVSLLRADPGEAAAPAAPARCAPVFVDCEAEGDARPRACFAGTVRVGRTRGGFVEVDYRGGGAVTGWTRQANVSESYGRRPLWIGDRATRRAATCP